MGCSLQDHQLAMKEERFWILLTKKIFGEASDEELAQLQDYIHSNPEFLTSHDRLNELFASEPKPHTRTDLQNQEDHYLNHVNRLKAQVKDFDMEADEMSNDFIHIDHKQTYFTKWIKVAVSIAAVGIGAFFLFNSLFNNADQAIASKSKPQNEVIVSKGSKSKIVLPDGTQVWINSGSKLTYDENLNGKFREVMLDGEAYFDVVHDPSRPFIVHTSDIDIHVLGTVFNVKAYSVDETIEATLIHGSIEVVNRNQKDAPKLMLKPHEKIIFNKDIVAHEKEKTAPGEVIKEIRETSFNVQVLTISKKLADSSIHETSWVYNKILFEEEKLKDIVKKLERWYNVQINLENEDIENIRLSGSFVDETIDEALRDLQLLVSFNYEIKNNIITITKK